MVLERFAHTPLLTTDGWRRGVSDSPMRTHRRIFVKVNRTENGRCPRRGRSRRLPLRWPPGAPSRGSVWQIAKAVVDFLAPWSSARGRAEQQPGRLRSPVGSGSDPLPPSYPGCLLPIESSRSCCESRVSEIHARICPAAVCGAVPSTLWSARHTVLPPR